MVIPVGHHMYLLTCQDHTDKALIGLTFRTGVRNKDLCDSF